jgi:hypothetical protein
MKILILISLNLILMTACSPQGFTTKPNEVPKTWYGSDSTTAPTSPNDNLEDPKALQSLEETIDSIFTANAEALQEADAESAATLSPLAINLSTPPEGKPKDWVPWRAEYFMTDLSITASGLVGALTLKGTSTVRAYWRKQGPVVQKTMELEAIANDETPNQQPVIMIAEDSSAIEMVKQLEPAVQAAVATGKIKDSPVLRKNLLETAQEFQAIASSIPNTKESLPWWVSRFRLDFSVDAAGRVEPVGMVGGEARFRFEWHRIRRTVKTETPVANLSDRQLRIRKSLRDFINATALDLDTAFADQTMFGFKAHQVRMGIGVSVKGNIGVVKGAAGVVGQIYFTREVTRPKVRPPAVKTASLSVEEPLYIIDRNPNQETLDFAVRNNSFLELNAAKDENGFEEALYKLDRKVFRKGILKAAKIGKFFAKRASKVKAKNWKVYELRTGFDASISAGLDLVTLAGTATAQISLFNQNF